ncbi:MAG: fasciclin domain-containing protein [Planctomycetota bacterium]|nr:fasciclin domain-containing protein [Planctomycetota bacterium]
MNRVNVCGIAFSLVALPSLAFAQCGGSTAEAPGANIVMASHEQAGDIVDTAVGAGKFNTLVALVKAAGLVDTLKGPGPFTVFAPTDEAFAKIPAATRESLLKPENKALLTSILTYHVVPGKVMAKDVKTGAAGTVNGQRVDLVAKDGKVTVDGATVTAADVGATNGVIHVIDTVIMPSTDTVVQTAVKNGNFKTLASLLEKTGLVGALNGAGPFTVFAPTDEAFAKLGPAKLAELAKPESAETLKKILTYHVVQGRVFSPEVAKGWTGSTLAGPELVSKSAGGKVTVSGATVTATDIDASNGVIHVIDTVLLPK